MLSSVGCSSIAMLSMLKSFLSLSIIFFAWESLSQSSETFCNRLYHSSIIANNTLYIDGGELRQSGMPTGVEIMLPQTVDTVDLSNPWSNNDTSLWGHISKTAPGFDVGPQSLNDGSIFSDSSSLFLYGGAVGLAPGALRIPPPNGVWQYDLSQGKWSNTTLHGDGVDRLILGSYVQSSSGGGYYLGGAKSPRSDAAFREVPDAHSYMVQGLLSFNESSLEFRNESSSGMNDAGTQGSGFLALIETIGKQGVLVAFGGFSNANGIGMNISDEEVQKQSLQLSFAQISVYDLANQIWYRQNATGDIPPWRYDGCAVVVSAPDQSSHSIYMFGGWGGTTAASNGFVYVLSLPSFRWIRVTQDKDLRQRHNCHLMGGNTMLVVGGIKPALNNLQPEGAEGCDTSAKFRQGLGMFSLNNHTWGTSYDPNIGAAPYTVHPDISKVIGGDANGGATLQAPVAGFAQASLGTVLNTRPEPKNLTTTPTNTPASASKGMPNAVKAGIAVGATVGVGILVGALTFLYLNRRRRKRHIHFKSWPPSISTPILDTPPPQMKYYAELKPVQPPMELGGEARDDLYAERYGPRELEGDGSGSGSIGKPAPTRKKSEVEIHEMEAWSPMSERSEGKGFPFRQRSR